MYAANGKAFDAEELFETICKSAQWYARNCGGSLTSSDVKEMISRAGERMVKSFHTYDPSRPIGPWLMRTVINAGRDILEEKSREKKMLLGYAAEYRVGERANNVRPLRAFRPDYIEDEESRIDSEALYRDYLDALDDERREIMSMKFAGYKSGEIAEELGIPANRVYKVIHEENMHLAAMGPVLRSA